MINPLNSFGQILKNMPQWLKISLVILLLLVVCAGFIYLGYWLIGEQILKSIPLQVKISLVILLLLVVLSAELNILGYLLNWGQRVKIPLVILLLLGVCTGLIYLGYWLNLDWTGFGGYDPKTHTKTFWDWLQLLIVPVVLAGGGFLLNYVVNRNQQKFTNDNQSDTVLRDYLDKISDFLFKDEEVKDSLANNEDSKVRREYPEHVKNLARLRTLIALRSLDSARKASLLLFLSESGLIQKEEDNKTGGKKEEDTCIIRLEKADFSNANLSIAYLSNDPLKGRTRVKKKWQISINKDLAARLENVNLSRAILIDADLSYANLRGADLSHASLHDANLSNADLTGANLTGADLDETDLSNANLTRAILTEADLKEAKLRGAYLYGANLTGAKNLKEADLSNAKLYGAILTGAKNLKEAKLKGTKYNTDTITITCLEKHEHSILKTQWPEGSEPGGTPDNKDQVCNQEQCELISKYVEKIPPYEHHLPQS